MVFKLGVDAFSRVEIIIKESVILEPDGFISQGKAPRRAIMRNIILLFGVLIAAIIGSAAYLAFQQNEHAIQHTQKDLDKTLKVAASIQDSEVEKLRSVKRIVRERNQKLADYLDYDKFIPLTIMLRNIAHIYHIDLVFLFDEDGILLTTNRTGTRVEDPSLYNPLISDLQERTGVEEVSAAIVAGQLPDFRLRSNGNRVLCIKSIVHVLHDTGDIIGYIVLVKLINGNKELAAKMTEIAGAEILYYDQDRNSVLTSFAEPKIPYPKDGEIIYQGKSYFAEMKDVTDFTGHSIGSLVVALDKKPILEHWRKLQLTNLLPFLVSVIISIIFFILLKTRVFDKISQLIAAQRRVTEGDLSIRLGIPSEKVASGNLDELEHMGIDFNNMMDRLEDTYDQLIKAQKDAEEANQAKSDFLANMSHELRTPLNHIIGFTELVMTKQFGELNETQEEYLNDALGSSKHLLSLINDILDLAKVEAGKLELEPSDVDLKMLLDNSLVMVKEKAIKHGIQLTTEIEGIPETVRADERKLKQVIYNLLSNAVKFTPEGGSVCVSARVIDKGLLTSDLEGSKCIEISVADTGIGLKPEDLERIFNPFDQVEESKSRGYQGTGLGLSLTKSLVELHGGKIWAESEGEGKGSTFQFVIPV